MLVRKVYGKETETLNLDQYTDLYEALDSIGDMLADLGISYKVPMDFILRRVGDKMEADLVKFGCPTDVAKEVVNSHRTIWTYGMESD